MFDMESATERNFGETNKKITAKLEEKIVELVSPPRYLTTKEMQELYTVESFCATFPFVIVRRKADNAKGTLQFQHMPRFYFNFVKE